jgi:polyhydroxyalkanoate synthase subunit PhaC
MTKQDIFDTGLDSSKIGEVQKQFFSQLQSIQQFWLQGEPAPVSDRRFSDPAWTQDRQHSFNAAMYLAQTQALEQMVECMQVTEREREKVRFAISQWIDAMSPANYFATNPVAQQRMLQTNGQSLMQGMQNLLADLNKGKISHTDDTAFEVGVNVGTSAGSVVFENQLIQLIQYAPLTPKVFEKPILFVPPCINKFYILDLQPENSLVRHMVEQGHTVFMVSWANAGLEQQHLTWDDYLQLGVCDAIEVVQRISGQDTINALGFCVGGTILTTALAALAAQGKKPVASLTLLTTFLDFSDTGALGLMVDEKFVQFREKAIGQGGLLKGKELATTFSFLRSNDLVWNYVVNNYLKGETPPAFDLLYWNGDSTNLAGPMYCWYLRNTYLNNQLAVPGACLSLGQAIDYGSIAVPAYVLNTREDHIVPWTGGYTSTKLLSGPVRFVLGASGHIAGVINPASKNKRSYWVSNKKSYPSDAQEWLSQAQEKPGSWWVDWCEWLKPQSGALVAANAGAQSLANASKKSSKGMGKKSDHSKSYPVIEAAPGRYVKIAAP